MAGDALDDFSGEPLTGIENKKLRKIIRDQERVDWLWASCRIWVGWIAAALAALFAAKEHIIKAVKAMFS